MDDVIKKYTTPDAFGWTLEVGQPGASKCIAKIYGTPVPRIGDVVMHQDINGPLTVIAVWWGVHRDYEVGAQVYIT